VKKWEAVLFAVLAVPGVALLVAAHGALYGPEHVMEAEVITFAALTFMGCCLLVDWWQKRRRIRRQQTVKSKDANENWRTSDAQTDSDD
jgi:hypothetical protein